MLAVAAREQDRERDGDDHEEYGAPGGEFGEEVGGAARAKRGLRALSTECASKVCGLALLQQNDADEEQADDNMNANEEDDHRECFGTSRKLGCGDGARRGPSGRVHRE